MGRTSARRLTPELGAAAPLPPLPPARSRLAQPCAAAAATPAAVIPAAHPHKSCSRSRSRSRSRAQPRQRRPAPERQLARLRPSGAGSSEAPPPAGPSARGGARPRDPPPAPGSRTAGANGKMGKERSSAERVLYPEEGGADSGDFAAGERTMEGCGVLKSGTGYRVAWGPRWRER